MSHVERASFLIGPTAAADATGKTGVYRYASSATVSHATLPTAWSTARTTLGVVGTGPYIRIQSITESTQVAFSKGNANLVYNQTAAIGTGNAVAGYTIPAGSFVDVEVPRDCDTINWISTSANGGGWVEFYMSEGGQ